VAVRTAKEVRAVGETGFKPLLLPGAIRWPRRVGLWTSAARTVGGFSVFDGNVARRSPEATGEYE